MFFLRLIWAVVHALFTKRADLVAENPALRASRRTSWVANLREADLDDLRLARRRDRQPVRERFIRNLPIPEPLACRHFPFRTSC